MFTSSDKFFRIQQQFKECSQFEQLSAIVELTRSFQRSYQYFLIQLYQINIQNENDDMFNLTVDHANTTDIVTCLLTNDLDKILFTLQLYLPLISVKTFNEKLFHAYREVLVHLDTNLSPEKFRYSTEQQILNYAQSVVFFIQTNPILQKLLSHIPKLIYLIQTKQFHSDEQHYPQPLQRYASIRSQIQPLMTSSSEVSSNSQQLIRHDTNDSGVDLTEPSMQSLLSSLQKKHPFVGKTTSSPIPEHATLDIPVRVPLKGVLSAPPPTTHYSDFRQKNSIYPQQKYVSSLAKSDEEEEDDESHKQIQDLISEKNHPMDNSKPLGQFYSLRYRNIKNSNNTEDVSQYLGVDANAAPVGNTFIQSNSGMKDVPTWLKHLRLHKYNVCFSQMTYDQMMNLTNEQLKAFHITEGACKKILLNIKELKERSAILKQCLIDLENSPMDLANLIQQLNELLMTPIRSKQLAYENHSDEDLPKLIVEVLEKIFHQLPSQASLDVYHNLLLLVDRCYKHEAFNEYAHLFLQWRRRLSNILQSLGKFDYKLNQSQQRRSIKPSVRPMKSTSAVYYSNSIPISKYNSEPQNNFIRRSILPYPTNEDSNVRLSTNHGAYLANNQHQALTRKASIGPQSENHSATKPKLCQTFSDPHRTRLQRNLIPMISTPYSQQPRQFISRSPPTSNLFVSKSPSDTENSDDHLELFCREITDKALGDDATDISKSLDNPTDNNQT